MKLQLTILSLLIVISGYSQPLMKDTSYFDGCNWITCKNGACMTTAILCADIDVLDTLIWEGDGEIVEWQDSLQAERFFTDSIGNQYIVMYSYVDNIEGGKITSTRCLDNHCHFDASCSIIKYFGNKQTTILKNYKAVYSPTPCAADNTKLWLKRLYEYQNKKK